MIKRNNIFFILIKKKLHGYELLDMNDLIVPSLRWQDILAIFDFISNKYTCTTNNKEIQWKTIMRLYRELSGLQIIRKEVSHFLLITKIELFPMISNPDNSQ